MTKGDKDRLFFPSMGEPQRERSGRGSTIRKRFGRVELLYSISKAYIARVQWSSTLPNLFELLYSISKARVRCGSTFQYSMYFCTT